MGDVSKLTQNQIQLLETAFRDFEINGAVPVDQIYIMLDNIGCAQGQAAIDAVLDELYPFGTMDIDLENFKDLASRFMSEEINPERLQQELREAFRLYDKEGNGYITTEVMREILAELDDNISEEDLDAMIDEIDSDGSGTVDFQEFMEVMTGSDD